ncbi:MAG: enoyl-CoA hydratase/isomerase family protein [Deltaproteobacteria bacterium]|nr:enoyl-CoA hydratase/isomerase family protein [Deltaproteobacteria bacterium]
MSCLIYESKDKVATISFNRSDKLNALNDELLNEFNAALIEAEQDDDVAALVLKGNGRAFCAGYDISGTGTADTDFDMRSETDVTELIKKQRRRQKSIFNLARFPKTKIAQVHGYCLEMGCSFVMACDISFADENAQFGDPSVRFGLTTDTPFWYHLVTHRKAKELLFTGRIIDGREAERIGIVTKAVPADQLEQKVREMALTASLTPFDGLTNNLEGFQTGIDARGLAEGWRSAADRRAFGILQRPASRSGEFNFLDVRDRKGLKVALAEMNAPYRMCGY